MAFQNLSEEISRLNELLVLSRRAAGTGHRPDKLGGHDATRSTHAGIRLLTDNLVALLRSIKPDLVISGGALGFDQYLGIVAVEQKIPLLLALPSKPFGDNWPPQSLGRKLHEHLVKKAAFVHYVTPVRYSLVGAKCLQDRNEWMVRHATDLIACWNGTRGGTANCLDFARAQVREGLQDLRIHEMWDSRYTMRAA